MDKNQTKVDKSVQLRDIHQTDLDNFFVFQLDKEANYMASFTPKDPSDRLAFDKHWNKILSTPDIINKTILYNDTVVGHIAKFVSEDKSEITYWLDKNVWGKGIATQAVNLFLNIISLRPLYARC